MEIEQRLTDVFARVAQELFSGTVYRVTSANAEALAASMNGGRWSPPSNHEPGFPVLYTSLDQDGAIAEVASYLSLLSPLPRKPLVVHAIRITTSKTVTLELSDLEEMGIDPDLYSSRNYSRTQEIGAAAHFMGLDALITPSARWDCQNLTVFTNRHAMEEELSVVSSEEFDWIERSIAIGLAPSPFETR